MTSSPGQKKCHRCKAPFESVGRPGFRDCCPQCQAYLHCCLNCRLYDPNAHHQCRSSTTEFAQDKEKANFCEEFDWMAGEKEPGRSAGQETKKSWGKLFGP